MIYPCRLVIMMMIVNAHHSLLFTSCHIMMLLTTHPPRPDVATHCYKGYVFFSNTSGVVYRVNRSAQNDAVVIYRSSHHPGPLSVDWLHDKLYIGEESTVGGVFKWVPFSSLIRIYFVYYTD